MWPDVNDTGASPLSKITVKASGCRWIGWWYYWQNFVTDLSVGKLWGRCNYELMHNGTTCILINFIKEEVLLICAKLYVLRVLKYICYICVCWFDSQLNEEYVYFKYNIVLKIPGIDTIGTSNTGRPYCSTWMRLLWENVNKNGVTNSH